MKLKLKLSSPWDKRTAGPGRVIYSTRSSREADCKETAMTFRGSGRSLFLRLQPIKRPERERRTSS